MSYTSQYSSSDVAPVTFDVIVGIGVALVSLTIIVALIILAKWWRGK